MTSPFNLRIRHNTAPVEPMVRENSPLFELPKRLERKQLLYLDALRHAAEIVDMSYRRLQGNLTDIAHADDSNIDQNSHTLAFIDAWAIVDAAVRFHSLLKTLPNGQRKDGNPEEEKTFDDVMSEIKLIRDIADHLPQRIDEVISANGPSLGTLTWFTCPPSADHAVFCALVPGTAFYDELNLKHATDEVLNAPTGCIRLQIAKKAASLSAVHLRVERVIRSIEKSLEGTLRGFPESEKVGGDVVTKTTFKLV